MPSQFALSEGSQDAFAPGQTDEEYEKELSQEVKNSKMNTMMMMKILILKMEIKMKMKTKMKMQMTVKKKKMRKLRMMILIPGINCACKLSII